MFQCEFFHCPKGSAVFTYYYSTFSLTKDKYNFYLTCWNCYPQALRGTFSTWPHFIGQNTRFELSQKKNDFNAF